MLDLETTFIIKLIMANLLSTKFSNKTAFIFDLDGTLIDMEEFTEYAYSRILKQRFDLDLTHEEYLKHFSGTRTYDAYETYLGSKAINDYDLDELVKEFRAMKRDGLENHIRDVVKLKPGVEEFLKELKLQGKQVALATSAIKEFAMLILKSFEIEQYFNLVLTAEDVTEGKPDPMIYNLTVEKLKVEKEKAVVFEDSHSGIQAAKSAGVYCIAILTKGLNDDAAKSADKIIENYYDIIN